LFFSGAAGRHALKETDWAGLAIYQQRELTAIETVNETPVLIDYRYRRLDQIGVDAQYVVRLRFGWLLGICDWNRIAYAVEERGKAKKRSQKP